MPETGADGATEIGSQEFNSGRIELERFNEEIDMKLGSLLRHNITLGLSLENAENEIARLNRVIEAQRSETAEA